MEDQFILHDDLKNRIDELKPRYRDKHALIVPVLHLVQDETGVITPDICRKIGNHLNIPPVKVYETACFYTMFNKKTIGKYHIQVCRSLSCSILGSDDLKAKLRELTGTEFGSTSQDGLFTLTEVECLGSCGTAPVLMVNSEYHENMNLEKLEKLILKLKEDSQ